MLRSLRLPMAASAACVVCTLLASAIATGSPDRLRGKIVFSAINRALGPTAGAEISTPNAKALLATSGTRSTS